MRGRIRWFVRRWVIGWVRERVGSDWVRGFVRGWVRLDGL